LIAPSFRRGETKTQKTKKEGGRPPGPARGVGISLPGKLVRPGVEVGGGGEVVGGGRGMANDRRGKISPYYVLEREKE